ncbi:MAG: ribosome biogenesis GTPase Der [Lysobacteraceae bacterium]|jgi:GTP-binding protein|nr:ribosome biogenesis GTPase Der [Xanthomonadaceae bacterium]MCZ8317491.1 ribosome biogenesis GTPase Der [Silanimonas sp.]
MLPLVALVGRPNVGKSTLFNALTRTRDALVHDEPGVTRDRHYGVCRLDAARPFAVVDTGGLSGEEAGLAGATARQARAGVDEADAIVFVVDAREGLAAMDREIIGWLRKTGKPLVLAVNKTDGLEEREAVAEFARFGIADVLPVAASHQRGVPALVELLQKKLPADRDLSVLEDDPKRVRVAFVGRPNVGKSTLVNRMLGEERMIASDVPGTTRDSIAVDLERDGKTYRLIDTAGLRRRGKVDEAVEKFSAFKTLASIEHCQVAVVLIDGTEGMTDQDATVLGHVLEAGRGLVVAVNKWDGLSTYEREQNRILLERKLAFAPWAERITISALHGSGLRELFRAVDRAHASVTRTFGTSEINRALEVAYETNPPPAVRGHAPKMRYGHSGGAMPPTFIIHGTRLRGLPESYRRYLENFFRKRFKLVGTPVRFEFREGENPYEGKKNELTDRQVAKRRRLMRFAKNR